MRKDHRLRTPFCSVSRPSQSCRKHSSASSLPSLASRLLVEARHTLAAFELGQHCLRLQSSGAQQDQAVKPEIGYFRNESIIVISREQGFDRFLTDLA